MKQKTILTAIVAIFFATFIGCSSNGALSEKNSPFATESMTDSIESHKGGLHYWSAITMDYPVKGNPQLINNIQEWMADMTEISDSVDFTSATDLMKDFNKRNEKYFKDFYLEDSEETTLSDEETPEDSGARMSRSLEFEKIFENDIFVTYLAKEDIYLNGAHGTYIVHGATFRKSDGRHFGFDMLKSSESDSICSLISKNMEAYYDVKSWNELKNYLSLDEYAEKVPMPQTPPFMKGDSLVFVYQQYEIASYAAGIPEAAIPLKDLKGLLAPTFVRTLNGK